MIDDGHQHLAQKLVEAQEQIRTLEAAALARQKTDTAPLWARERGDEMNAEQKATLRDNAQSILDLAECRLREQNCTDVNVRHDLGEIIICARRLFDMVGPRRTSVFVTAGEEYPDGDVCRK